MRKRIFLLPFLATAFGLHAQSIGNSPYASFGIGEVKYDNSVETVSYTHLDVYKRQHYLCFCIRKCPRNS